jgi:hypothetical protein
MADRFAAAIAPAAASSKPTSSTRSRTFIVRDPADASRRATELIRDFVLKRAPGG